MASNLYQEGIRRMLDRGTGTLDPLAASVKVMLVTSGYTPNKDHQFVADVVASELSGTGYAGGYGGSGRKALASRAIGKNDTTDKAYFDAADLTWTAINAGTVAYAIVFAEVTSDALSPLMACVDISPDVVTNGGDYTIQWDAAGIATFSA